MYACMYETLRKHMCACMHVCIRKHVHIQDMRMLCMCGLYVHVPTPEAGTHEVGVR
jgi:hypothetical protein